MKSTLRVSSLVAFAAALLLLGSTMMAQDQGGPGAGGPGAGGPGAGGPGFGGPGGGRRAFDPAQMQERMLENYKTRLNATDEEWTALKPLVAEVIKNQQAGGRRGGMMGGMMGGRRNRGGQGGDQAGQPGGPQGGPQGMRAQNQMPEQAALQAAVENESTPAPELKAKVEAYRAAVKKQEEALKQAREKLRAALTPRQEAILVLSGLLD